MKPIISINLSRHDGETTVAHLERIAGMYRIPGHGHGSQEAATSAPVGIETLPTRERDALEAETAAKRAKALSRLSQRRRHGDR